MKLSVFWISLLVTVGLYSSHIQGQTQCTAFDQVFSSTLTIRDSGSELDLPAFPSNMAGREGKIADVNLLNTNQTITPDGGDVFIDQVTINASTGNTSLNLTEGTYWINQLNLGLTNSAHRSRIMGPANGGKVILHVAQLNAGKNSVINSQANIQIFVHGTAAFNESHNLRGAFYFKDTPTMSDVNRLHGYVSTPSAISGVTAVGNSPGEDTTALCVSEPTDDSTVVDNFTVTPAQCYASFSGGVQGIDVSGVSLSKLLQNSSAKILGAANPLNFSTVEAPNELISNGCDGNKCTISERPVERVALPNFWHHVPAPVNGNKITLQSAGRDEAILGLSAANDTETSLSDDPYKNYKNEFGNLVTNQSADSFEFKTDHYDTFYINRVTLASDSNMTLHAGTYWIKTLVLNGGNIHTLTQGNEKVVLHVQTLTSNSGKINRDDSKAGNLQVFVHNAEGTSLTLNGGRINGMVYSQGKTWMNGASRLNGTLTSRILLMEGTSQITSNTTALDNMCSGWEDYIPPPPPPVGSCKILFGDGGIQGNRESSRLTMGDRTRIIAPDGSYIQPDFKPAITAANDAYCGNNTRCTTSGEYLGGLTLGEFKTPTVSGTYNLQTGGDVTLTSSDLASYNNVNVTNGSKLTIIPADGEEIILNKLSVSGEKSARNSTVVLYPGRYYLNEFTVNSPAHVELAPESVTAGVANIHVKTWTMDGSFNAQFNSSSGQKPDPNNQASTPKTTHHEAHIIVYNTSQWLFNTQSHVHAFMYFSNSVKFNGRAGANSVNNSQNSNISGAIAAHNVTLDADVRFKFMVPSLVGDICVTDPDVPLDPIDHYELSYLQVTPVCTADSNLTPVATVTIKACENADCSVLASNNSQIDLSLMAGQQSVFQRNGLVVPANQALTLNLPNTIRGTAQWQVSDASPTAVNGYKCVNSATCEMTFSEHAQPTWRYADNQFSIPTQIAEKAFPERLSLVCASGQVNSIELGLECLAPATCSTKTFIVTQPNGSFDIARSDNGTPIHYTSVSVGNGSASVNADDIVLSNLVYNDAGHVRLLGTINGQTIQPASFHVRPWTLDVSADADGSANSADAYPDSKHPIAGDNHALTLQALGFLGGQLPNYQPQNLSLSAVKTFPSAEGREGVVGLSNAITGITQTHQVTTGMQSNQANSLHAIANISAGYGISNGMQMYYSEFGKLQLQFSDNYAGHEVLSNIQSLGEYIPHHLEVSEVNSASMSGSCNAITYVAESLPVSQLDFNVTAYNSLDQMIYNFDHDNYWQASNFNASMTVNKLDSYPTAVANIVEQAPTMSPSSAADTAYDGVRGYSIKDMVINYPKGIKSDQAYIAPVLPFTPQVNLTWPVTLDYDSRLIDPTANKAAVISTTNDYTSSLFDSPQLRWGRIRLGSQYGATYGNVYDGVSSHLNVPVVAESWQAPGQFDIESLDNCSQYKWSTPTPQLAYTTDISGYQQVIRYDDSNDSDASYYTLVSGESPADIGLQVPAPTANTNGIINLLLTPMQTEVPFLSFDWNGDGKLDDNDKAPAILQFGVYRGNDRIIFRQEGF